MKILKILGMGLAVLVALALLWLSGGGAFARSREARAERAWVRSFGSYEELLKRYPRMEMNDTARVLERIAKRVGMDLTPKTRASIASFSEKPQKDELAEGRSSLSEFLMVELRKPEANVGPVSLPARAFLTAHSEDLRAVEQELLTAEPPRWSYDAAASDPTQPIPDTSAMIGLQRVLLARALAAYADGDKAAAFASLEASWKLNQEFRRIPETVVQIVARGAAYWELGVVRKIPVDEEIWRARLSEHDYKRGQLDAELLASWPSTDEAGSPEDPEETTGTSQWKRLSARFRRPYETLIWSLVAEGTRRDLVEIRDSRLVRDFSATSPKRLDVAGILLSIRLPNTHSLFRRVDEYLLAAELTEKILQARELRAQNGGAWPASIPGIEETCMPNARWVYAVSPDGILTIQLNRKPFTDRYGFQLPLCFISP